MSVYSKNYNNRVTDQSSPIPGRDMVKNNQGGFVFKLDDFGVLDRFLVIGSEGGSYYSSEKKLTEDNAKTVISCIKSDGPEVVRRIVAVSDAGRAPKNSPALFALALCATYGDEKTKNDVRHALPKVARIGTHIFEFVDCVNGLRGWGRGLKKTVANWYLDKSPLALANQVIKYQQRDGWSHRDLLRLAHVKFPKCDTKHSIAHWITKGWPSVGEHPHSDNALLPIWAFEVAKKTDSEKEIVRLIREYNLPRECVPTKWLNSLDVWEALLDKMPITAMIRNLGKMTSIGLLKPLSLAARKVIDTVTDEKILFSGRVHPLNVLVALRTYQNGKGDKGSLTWTPNQQIVAALDSAFYTSFGAIEPTNKSWLLALDCSASMTWANCCGMPITPREASAAMAMVAMKTENNHLVTGFTSNGVISQLPVHKNMSLSDVMKVINEQSVGGTDCSLPMQYAMANELQVDAFVIYTDNETRHGSIHPVQALRQYRNKMQRPAKLVVCGMTSTNFTISDPNDGGCMDVVGFDTATPSIMADFVQR